jgi:hypothetical protein
LWQLRHKSVGFGCGRSAARTGLGAVLPNNREKYREKSEKMAARITFQSKSAAFTDALLVFPVLDNREEKSP